MKIGELAERTRVSRDTIRYYEKLGLLPISGRQSNSTYKNYGLPALERLEQIQQFKTAGFTLLEIRDLLSPKNMQSSCVDLPSRLADKIQKIDEQIAMLNQFKTALLRIQQNCSGHCASTKGMPDCMPIMGS